MMGIKIIIGLSAALYYIASIFYFIGDNRIIKLFGKVKKQNIAYALHAAAFILNTVIMIINWTINGYVPFVSYYQVLIFLAFTFPFTYLYIKYVKDMGWTIGYFSLCSAVFLTGTLFMNHKLIWHFPPALQSPYFLPHVMSYMLSYTLCAVGFLLTLIMLIKKDKQEKKRYELAIYHILLTAFPFMVLGLFLGAIWANQCWGNYWSWDPKETWALVTMCLYALYFHTRKIARLKLVNEIILILAFLALLMTFIGINIFGAEGVHSYT